MNKYNSIRHTNVYSKSYRIPYTQFQESMAEFVALIKKNNLSVSGNLFYTLNMLDSDANIEVELFCPTKEGKITLNSGLRFHSYYMVNHMISVVVKEDFEEGVQRAYMELMEFANRNNKEIISAFYHEIRKSQKGPYYIVKVVVRERKVG